uniref:p55 C-terminal domain-containing protein n=1 Tax=Emaravirus tritici TaxID=1980428 RepID=A0A7T8I170_9VIRU|nr:P5 hypothetical protein [Emaravirus tritici]
MASVFKTIRDEKKKIKDEERKVLIEMEIRSRTQDLKAIKSLTKKCEMKLSDYHGRFLCCIDGPEVFNTCTKVTTWEPKSGKVRGINILGQYQELLENTILNEVVDNMGEDKLIYGVFEMLFLVDLVTLYEINPKELIKYAVDRFDDLIMQYRFQSVEKAISSCRNLYLFYKKFIKSDYKGTMKHFVLVEKCHIYSQMINNMDAITYLNINRKLYDLVIEFINNYQDGKSMLRLNNKLKSDDMERLKGAFNQLVEPINYQIEHRLEYLGRSCTGYETYELNNIPPPGFDKRNDFFYYKIPIPVTEYKSIIESISKNILNKDDIDEACYGSKYISKDFRIHVLNQYRKLNGTIKMDNLTLYLISFNLLDYCRIHRAPLETNFEPRVLVNVRAALRYAIADQKKVINELKDKDGYMINRIMHEDFPIVPVKYYDPARNIRPNMKVDKGACLVDFIDDCEQKKISFKNNISASSFISKGSVGMFMEHRVNGNEAV